MKYYNNMMEAMTNFFEAMKKEHEVLVAESNAQAEEARSLISRVQTTVAKHEELVSLMGTVSARVRDEHTSLQAVTANIKDALANIYEGEVPECAVEQFEGYCDSCGEEVTTETKRVGEYGLMLCPLCYEAEIEAEPEADEV